MRNLDILLQPTPPWLLRYHGPRPGVLRSLGRLAIERDRLRVIILEGEAMRTINNMHDELTRKFALPDYFGRNLDALDECLTDLEWMPATAYVAAICNCEQLLLDEDTKSPEALFDCFDFCGEQWSRPVAPGESRRRVAIPFHTILQFGAPSFDPPAFARGIPPITI